MNPQRREQDPATRRTLSHRFTRRFAALVAGIAALALNGWGQGGEQEISVEISKPGVSMYRVAIPEIPSKLLGLGDLAGKVLTGDMQSSGVVAVVDPKLYPLVQPRATLEGKLEQWRSIQAQFLLEAEILREGNKLVLEGRLYDLASKRVILGKRYRGEPALAKKIAHTFANDILLYFTGKPGIFLTKVTFVSDRDAAKEIYLMDFDGENQQRLTNHRSLSMSPEWSDTGDSIVYCTWIRGGPQLYLAMRADGAKKQITDSGSLNISPAISPDGTRIAFVRSLDGNPEIFVVSRDGSGMRQLTTSRAIEASPNWSPTGREISFTSNRAGSPQVYVMDAEGTNVRRLTFEGSYNDEASWSPDGNKLLYTSRTQGTFQLKLIDIAGGRIVQLTEPPGNNEEGSWSPDGSKIVFASNRSGNDQIYSMNADGGNQVQLTSQGNNFSPDWSRYLP